MTPGVGPWERSVLALALALALALPLELYLALALSPFLTPTLT